jgi:hypothetical protein
MTTLIGQRVESMRKSWFTGINYLQDRDQPYQVWWSGRIIYFAASEEEAQQRLSLESTRKGRG